MVSTRPSLDYTRLAVDSFFSTTTLDPEDKFVLIDNDGSLQGEPWLPSSCEVRPNSAPRGFAANFNTLIVDALDRSADLYLLNNDLVFTAGWSEPLRVDADAILSPLSNREVQYAHSIVVPKTGHVVDLTVFTPQFSLDQFRGHESAFAAIAEAHRRACEGYLAVYVVPFFCAKVPLAVLRAVGLLDERYGRGGGEDFDYCLRSHLAGFPVAFAVNSYVLHFGGKSSWSGVETNDEQSARERHFREVFRSKWGAQLFELILREDSTVLDTTAEMNQLDRSGKLGEVVQRLLGEQPVAIHIGSARCGDS